MKIFTLAFAVSAVLASGQKKCPLDEFIKPAPLEADVVLVGTLAKPAPGDSERLPLFNSSDYAMLYIKVRVNRVDRGSFPVRTGDEFLLAVHSIALQFGYDYVGEVYQVSFKAAGDDFALVHQAIPSDHIFAVRLIVREVLKTVDTRDDVVNLSDDPTTFWRVEVATPLSPPELIVRSSPIVGLRIGDYETPAGSEVCLVIVRRSEEAVRRLRMLRLYY